MNDALQLYPALAHVQPGWAELLASQPPSSVPPGTVLFTERSPCQGFPLVLEGEIRVSRQRSSTSGSPHPRSGTMSWACLPSAWPT